MVADVMLSTPWWQWAIVVGSSVVCALVVRRIIIDD